MNIERKKEQLEIWNVCICGKVLHSISEGKRGTCATCWFKSLGDETKKALNRVVGMAFKPTTEKEREDAVNEALETLKKEETKK